MLSTKKLFERRRARTRYQVRKLGGGKPRLSVHRTNKQIYAQIIDDLAGGTVAAASTMDQDFRSGGKSGGNSEAAAVVGKLIAERAKAAGIEQVVFDRGGFRFHGRVKALADAAREAGLKF